MDVASTEPAEIIDVSRVRRWIETLTPVRCRLIFAAVTLSTLVGHVWYLHHCPIDLSGDEAHYWDWSRRLDYGYYSKGPLVAWIIRASCAIFGDTMPAVRYPALLLAAMSAAVSYLLTLKLFRSDRLALGASLLYSLVPMFVAGSLLMTIDPPFFLCWAVATYALARSTLSDRKWGWPAAGAAIGIGFLAKFGALLWLVGAFVFLIACCRQQLKTAGPWLMLVIALACTTPTLVWNAHHDWVSFRHVAHQVGLSSTSDGDEDEARPEKKSLRTMAANTVESLAGQVGVVGPGLIVLMIGAGVYTIGRRSQRDPRRPALQLLLIIGGSFWLITFLDNFRGKVQVNWPAPAYFTLVILSAYFVAQCAGDPRRWHLWRNWVYLTVGFGILMLPITHDFGLLYPAISAISPHLKKPLYASKIDPTVKLRGWSELGHVLGKQLQTMPPNTFILCDDYQQTAETAFYTPGQPITYCAGSYFDNPKRHTQYDLWADRAIDPSSTLVGRDAIYVGKAGAIPAEVRAAFDHVEPMDFLDITVDGVKIRSFRPWRCTGFKGMIRASNLATY